MRINIHGLNDELSRVRGIGSYNQMLTEAIERYGKKEGLELAETDYDVNLITDFNPVLPVKTLTNKPNVIVIHDLISLKYPQHFPLGLRGKWRSLRNLFVIKNLTGVLTDTEAVKKEILIRLGLASEKVQVVYLAAKAIFENTRTPKESPLFNKLPLEYILYVGDVTWNKNLPRLARAVKRINKTLVLVGSALQKRQSLNHPWKKSFREFLKEVENDQRFIFLGYVPDEDEVALYQRAKAVASVSLEEGFGFPWLEAAWLRTPVVVGKTAVSEEIMKEAAEYVNPLSVSSIATGLENVFYGDNRVLLTKQSERAKEFSQQKFVVKLKKALYNLLNV